MNVFLDDNLFILILIASGICLTIDAAGCLELTLMYIEIALDLLKEFLRIVS